MQFAGSSSIVVVNLLIMNKIGLEDGWKSIRIVYASKYKRSGLISIDRGGECIGPRDHWSQKIFGVARKYFKFQKQKKKEFIDQFID